MMPSNGHAWGSWAGWIGGACLAGLLFHSLLPTAVFGMGLVAWGTVLSVAGIALAPRGSHQRLVACCALAFVVGVWRFDAIAPTLPRGLRPLDASSLVFLTNRNQRETEPWKLLAPLREELRARANSLFPPDESALLTGLLYGDKNLSKERKADFRTAGLLHIVAVSGSNVTIVVVLVSHLLLGLGLRRRTTFFVFSAALLFFLGFVGFSASVVRAAIMGWLVELAPVVGRVPRASRLLLLSALAFTLWHPWSLLYDASFALSFLAMWGLLTWGTWLEGLLKDRVPRLLGSTLAATTGATIMTMPYSAWAFGNVSLFGFFSNMIVLPLVPWAMGMGALALAADLPWLALPAQGFLQAILAVAAWTARLPWGAWSDVQATPLFLVGCYALIAVLWRLKHSFFQKEGVDR